MILHITKHELRRFYRDGRSRALVLSVAIMLLVAMFLGLRDFQIAGEQFQTNVEQGRVNWVNQAEKNPHDAAHDGTYVIKPFHPLAMFDKGIQQYSGQVVHLGAHERKQSTLNQVKDKSGMFRFGELTPNFVLLYLFPLLLIFLGFSAFTEERQRQTIRLLLTQGVSTQKLAIGKWLALLIQMVLLSLLFLIGAVICQQLIQSDVSIALSEWVGFILIYLLYFIIFSNIVLFVSSRAKSSGTSLTILLAIWIVVTLIVPKFSTNLAGSMHPFPTLQTFRNNINEDQQNGLNGHNFWNEAAQDFQQKVLDQYGVDTIEELPVAYGGLLLAEGEKYESEIYTKHFDLLREQYGKQREVYRFSSSLSPFLPVRFVSMALARSDYGFQWHYEDAAEKYRVVFNTALNMNIAENSKGVENYKASAELWNSIPRFDYEWQEADLILQDHRSEYLIMVFWALISFGAMIFSSRKLKAI